MNSLSIPVQLVIAFVVVAILTFLVKRWNRGFGLGVVGLVLLVIPATLRYFETHDWFYPVCTILGILMIAFDLARPKRAKE